MNEQDKALQLTLIRQALADDEREISRVSNRNWGLLVAFITPFILAYFFELKWLLAYGIAQVAFDMSTLRANFVGQGIRLRRITLLLNAVREWKLD